MASAAFFKRIVPHFRRIPLFVHVSGIFVLVAIVAALLHGIASVSPAVTPPTETHVHLASVASLSGAVGPLPVIGTVSSKSQATVLSQTSGEIVDLSRSLGDYVSAGSVIASFENASQQATVLQAEGAYEAAEAALAKTRGANAAGNAGTTAAATISSVYGILDDAVHTKADPLFSSPRSSSPKLLGFTVPDSQLVVNVENERAALEGTLTAAQSLPHEGDINAALASMTAAARSTQSFLNDLIAAMNIAVPNPDFPASTIAAEQAALAAARSEVSGALSSLAATQSAYDSATAAQSSGSGVTSDIAAAEASVKSAEGVLNAAKAALEKTIARAPISGTIVSLPVKQGDYVTAFSPVAVVSNSSALEVDTYVTSDDAATLAVGAGATVNGDVLGRITFIAPALDPLTGKIEVKVGLTGNARGVTDGETVPVSLSRAQKTFSAGGGPITVPIAAVKITPAGPAAFVVASSTLHAVPVTLGTILGETVTVAEGLSPDMEIVTDARGLSDGETVVVDP